MSSSEPDEIAPLELAGRRRLVLKRSGESDAITLLEHDGKIAVTVVVTAEAITLSLGGADLEVNVERNLSIEAQSIALRGREGVAISTEGKLATTGRSQSIVATHGDVALDANDDVKLGGERILLNC